MRKPRWNIAAAALQPIGVVIAYTAGCAFSPAGSLYGLVVIGRIYSVLSLVGVVVAIGAFARRERWPLLSYAALMANGIAVFVTYPVLVRDPSF